MPAHFSLSILIVNWNTRDALAQCLEAIPGAANEGDYEIVVVDNHSQDGSAEMVRQRFAHVRCVSLQRNIGFGAGVNLGIKMSCGQYVLLLNPDIVPDQGAIARLTRYLEEHRSVAITGARLVGPDGASQREDYYVPFPTLLSALIEHTSLVLLARRWGLPRGLFRDTSVRQVPGACLLTRREVLERVGPFDEDFFVWFEDVDWCYRAFRSGLEMSCCEEAVFVHLGGKSFEGLSVGTRKKWFFRSLLRFFKKHKGTASWAVLAGVIIMEEILILVLALVVGLIFPSQRQRLQRAKRGRDYLVFLAGVVRDDFLNRAHEAPHLWGRSQ